ncbi:MAG: Bug family tripartite tricarboxylate transporter substrate binding protein [Hydrogenophaga sp.]|uniref:Bug family tripartite tricarboxylate transporter substrate binding protein n=1 Tax=Hydrogenophaga sp. TaxID=1904254 RepID=UPI004035884F
MSLSAPLSRRLAIAALMACTAGTTLAQAPAYPARPVTVVVPFAPGGSVDSAARLTLQALGDRLKQPFVVENVAGASGTVGTQRVARATPDGYTLLFAVASPINVAPVVKPSIVRYDAFKDFAPIATVASSPFVLVGTPKLAAPTTADVIALARQSPGKLNYGTDGVGTSMHLTAEIIKLGAGVDIVHVPYKSGPQVLTELSSGLIELAVMPVTLAQPFIKDGKVKAYGVTSRQRWASMPDVPALAETPALKSVDVDSWYGLFAPAGTDAAIVTRVAAALREALKDPTLVEKMNTAGLKPMSIERDEFTALLKRERETLAAAVKAAGIQPE